jgi:hypothetical protein
MAMKPRSLTTFQSFLVSVFSIAGFLGAPPLATSVGLNAPFLVGSFIVACFSFVGLYYTRRSTFFYRLSLTFVGCLSSFTVLFLLYTLAPR